MKRKITIGVMAVSVIFGGAMAAGAMDKESVEAGTNKAVESNETVSMYEAKRLALLKQDGTVESVELESLSGKKYYDVEIENSDKDYDIHIDAKTGEVLSTIEEKDDDFESAQSSNKNLISEEEAIKTAEKAGNGSVIEMDKDEDDGKIIYEFELSTNKGEVEIEIDAVTGKIIDWDQDDDNDDDRDDIDNSDD